MSRATKKLNKMYMNTLVESMRDRTIDSVRAHVFHEELMIRCNERIQNVKKQYARQFN